jgi:hypothetical protein
MWRHHGDQEPRRWFAGSLRASVARARATRAVLNWVRDGSRRYGAFAPARAEM